MSMRGIWSLRLGTLALLASLTLSSDKASAGSIWVIPENTSNDGHPIAGQATFTFGDNSLEIHIKNLVVDQRSSGQSISGINFVIDGSPTGMQFQSGNGVFVEINSNGIYTLQNGGSTQSTTRWDLNSNGGITTLTGGQPRQLIVGAPGANNKYDNANPSITNRNPHLFQEATFSISFTGGVNSSSTVSSVDFLYSTNGDKVSSVLVPDPTAVPEPSTIAMTCLGLLAPLSMAGMRHWRRRSLVELD